MDTINQSLSDARLYVLRHREDGVDCPCCGQLVKVYRRQINHVMARSLILLNDQGSSNYFNMIDLVRKNGLNDSILADFPKLRFWGLIVPYVQEVDDKSRADGSKRSGWFRITNKGRLFACNLISAPKYAVLYNNELLEMDWSEMVNVVDCLGKKFNYSELMEGK